MQHTFETPGPVSLVVEIQSGDVVVRTADTDRTVVDVTGNEDAVTVEQSGDEVRVVARPGRSGFSSLSGSVSVSVSLPHDSRLATKLGSADLRAEGRLTTARVRVGSGQVDLDELSGAASVQTGSGDVRVDTARGTLEVRSGSGVVSVAQLHASAEVSTGSGDVVVDQAHATLSARSGSGDIRVREGHADLLLSTASGDVQVDRVHRGRLTAKNVSGDVLVGVPAGIPVWTDVSTMTGSVRSSLQGAGQPAEGEDHLELRATTVSGDVELRQL